METITVLIEPNIRIANKLSTERNKRIVKILEKMAANERETGDCLVNVRIRLRQYDFKMRSSNPVQLSKWYPQQKLINKQFVIMYLFIYLH